VGRWREFVRALEIPEEGKVALLPGAAGVAIMLISVLDPRDGAFGGGRIPVFAAGCAFLLAGIAIFLLALKGASGRKRAAGALVVFLFAVPPLVVAFYARIWPGTSNPPPPPVFEPVVLSLDREAVYAGAEVGVRFDRPFHVPAGYGCFVCIARPATDVGFGNTWVYFASGATEVLVGTPITPGDYEIRLHPHLSAVVARLPISVLPNPDATPEQQDPVLEKERPRAERVPSPLPK
jgi:hypothetical protein